MTFTKGLALHTMKLMSKRQFNKLNQQGQLILTLILVMTVALAIGLSIIQKSLLDVSTATKVEQSSRAFSAAEAGIEKALRVNDCGVNGVNCKVDFAETKAKADVLDTKLMPVVVSIGTPQDPLEYPPLAKEDVVQIWLADLTSKDNPPAVFYDPSPIRAIDVYWGTSGSPITDRAALELNLIYYDGNSYQSYKKYLDSTSRNPNSFELVATCNGNYTPTNGTQTYQCKRRIGPPLDSALPSQLMLVRARLFYNSTSQPFAVQAVNTCGQPCSLPPQARVLISTGTVGDTQRRVKVFQENKVVPTYFDYAIFSAGDIVKQ